MAETWLRKKELSHELLCSERTIDEFCAQSVFTAGSHFYRAGLQRGSLVFCLERCREALLSHTADREAGQAAAPTPVTYDEEHLNQLIEEIKS